MAGEKQSFLEKVGDWMKDHHLRPCVKFRNLSDPLGDRMRNGDPDYPSDGKPAVEVGIKFDF